MTFIAQQTNGDSAHDGVPKPTHESTFLDGVLRWPSTGLKVLIVGGGPAGLLTALECWKEGHDVEVVEKNSKNSTIGEPCFLYMKQKDRIIRNKWTS